MLADMRSKKVLYGIIKFWIDLDFDYKNTLVEKNFDSYFDMDILKGMSGEEVIVDCGAYTGDSILSYLENFTGYSKVYAYEMVPSIFEKLKENLKDYENIEFHNAAISSNAMSKKKVFINDNSKVSTISLKDPENASVYDDEASVPNKPDSKVPVEMTTIDHEIPEKITFSKMDIEGSETDAIKGGKNHIKIDKPKMAIAAYHKYSDLWDLAEMLNKLNSNYRFYLRYNGASNGYMTSEYVLYAV
jgi:FkbM family methyltransferase